MIDSPLRINREGRQMDMSSMRRQARYGMPAADQILFNRNYILGYSYYFRQAKWALEIVDPTREFFEERKVKRSNNFRPDYRIPEMFRADLEDYVGSKKDRGHLVASANQRRLELQNSETFLLTNMVPQAPKLNRGIWKDLEGEIRNLDDKKNKKGKKEILETYVICGPIFYFDQPVKFIGMNTANEVAVPIPNAFFKSVLAENRNGRIHMWSFIFPNEEADKPLENYRVTTTKVEQYAGIQLWGNLEGTKIAKEKKKTRKMW